MLTAQAIDDFKNFVENNIAFAKVTVNGTVKQLQITKKEKLSDNRVAVYVNITPQQSQGATITRVQLYNTSKQLWADKAENIRITSAQEGALYRFVFKFQEQEV